jgi:hypothetical protein
VRDHLAALQSTTKGGGGCGLRRGISLWLVDDFTKEQREMEEDGEGVL